MAPSFLLRKQARPPHVLQVHDHVPALIVHSVNLSTNVPCLRKYWEGKKILGTDIRSRNHESNWQPKRLNIAEVNVHKEMIMGLARKNLTKTLVDSLTLPPR